MGEYRDDWFSFEVKSKRHIMYLIIEPSFAKAGCFQVHEMEADSFKLFWNYELRPKEYVPLIKKYFEINSDKIAPKMSIAEFFFGKEFAAFMRQHTPEIFVADLNANDMALVAAVVNADWQYVKYRCGLDGHSYTIKIYGEEVREFKCWCNIPKAWSELIPLVDRLTEIAKLEPRDCYEVHGVY